MAVPPTVAQPEPSFRFAARGATMAWMEASPAVLEQRALRADAQRNHERILTAARDAFAELGADARMEEIASRAGVGVGTVYRHFATKEALMAELVADKWRFMGAQVREALESVDDPWEAFAGALRRNAETMSEDAGVRSAILGADSPEVWEGSAEAHAELMDATRELMLRGQAAGVIRDDVSVLDIPILMCGVCATMDPHGPEQRTDWRRHLELVLQGMRAS
jgi:AcrR family transcriptional regulator